MIEWKYFDPIRDSDIVAQGYVGLQHRFSIMFNITGNPQFTLIDERGGYALASGASRESMVSRAEATM